MIQILRIIIEGFQIILKKITICKDDFSGQEM